MAGLPAFKRPVGLTSSLLASRRASNPKGSFVSREARRAEHVKQPSELASEACYTVKTSASSRCVSFATHTEPGLGRARTAPHTSRMVRNGGNRWNAPHTSRVVRNGGTRWNAPHISRMVRSGGNRLLDQPLFPPGIRVVVVSAHLPEPQAVSLQELDLAQPLA